MTMTTLDRLLALQHLYATTPRWRLVARWELRREREKSLRELVESPPELRPKGEAPLLRRL